MHLNQAVDQVRRAETGRLRGRPLADKLKHLRWKLLRRGSRVRGRAKPRLCGLLHTKLATGRAWMLKETFQDFWRYRSLTWASAFLDVWCCRALRSRIEPMKKVARMLRTHQELLLNWFRAKGEVSTGAVEGLNNKIRVVTRRSYGFRAMEIALYHTLGRLPNQNLPIDFAEQPFFNTHRPLRKLRISAGRKPISDSSTPGIEPATSSLGSYRNYSFHAESSTWSGSHRAECSTSGTC